MESPQWHRHATEWLHKNLAISQNARRPTTEECKRLYAAFNLSPRELKFPKSHRLTLFGVANLFSVSYQVFLCVSPSCHFYELMQWVWVWYTVLLPLQAHSDWQELRQRIGENCVLVGEDILSPFQPETKDNSTADLDSSGKALTLSSQIDQKESLSLQEAYIKQLHEWMINAVDTIIWPYDLVISPTLHHLMVNLLQAASKQDWGSNTQIVTMKDWMPRSNRRTDHHLLVCPKIHWPWINKTLKFYLQELTEWAVVLHCKCTNIVLLKASSKA